MQKKSAMLPCDIFGTNCKGWRFIVVAGINYLY